MRIDKNTVVELSYELETDGKIVDRAGEDKPLDYIHGSGMLLPKFEAEIEGKEPGDSFAFVLSPEEGYGTHDPKRCFDLPKASFAIDGQVQEELLEIGRMIPMLNSSGQVVQGMVTGVKEDAVTMDFNHPMAGKTLNFKGKILSVRNATEKELVQGLHGEFLPEEDCCCGGHHGNDGECCHGGKHGHDGECCHGGHHHEHDGECCHGGKHKGSESGCNCDQK